MDFLINIDVPDLANAETFYCSALPLRVQRRLGPSAVELSGGPAPIYLLEQPQGSPAASSTAQTRDYARHWTPVHLDFGVDDVERAVQTAVSAGARLEAPVSSQAWGKLALLADPFGNGFCFVQFVGRGYDAIAT